MYVRTLRLMGLRFKGFLEVGHSLITLHMKPSRKCSGMFPSEAVSR